MRAVSTAVPDVLVIEPTVHGDERGYFFEAWNRRSFADATGTDPEFVQDNQSSSRAGVVRGLHYQLPNPQGKLIRVLAGSIWDVAVDIRRSSPTFGVWVGVELSAANRQMLWVPEGFAHGFAVLSTEAEVLYKTTSFYDRSADKGIFYADPSLAIDWPVDEPILSDRDRELPSLDQAELFP